MYKQKWGEGRTPTMLFIQFQNIFHTPYGRIFFSFSSLFHRCNYNSFHLPQRDHLEYCKDCVKLETSQGTLKSYGNQSPPPLQSSAVGLWTGPLWSMQPGSFAWGLLIMGEGYTLFWSFLHPHHHLASRDAFQLDQWCTRLAWNMPQPTLSLTAWPSVWHFLIPCTHRRSRHFYTTFLAQETLASTSHLCHMEPIKGLNIREASAKHLLILTFLVHDYF